MKEVERCLKNEHSSGKGRWCEIWDGPYWRFIDRHRDVLRRSFRMEMMVAAYDRMPQLGKMSCDRLREAFLAPSLKNNGYRVNAENTGMFMLFTGN